MHKPLLYIFVGYPGAGKTTIARWLADQTDAVHIWADRERQNMFSEPNHGQTESVELYNYLNQQTEKLLNNRQGVIFDTNFNYRKDRDYLRSIALGCNAEAVVIWVTTPLEVAKKRAVHDLNLRNGYKDLMTAEQFNAIVEKLEPPTKDEHVIKINGTKFDESELKRLLRL